MKKVDLNIQCKEVKDEKGKITLPSDLAKRWITIMIERAINKPDNQGRATQQANMDTQRRCFKVLNILDNAENGIATFDDDDFDFLYRKFHQAEIAFQKDIAEILCQVEKALDKAKA